MLKFLNPNFGFSLDTSKYNSLIIFIFENAQIIKTGALHIRLQHLNQLLLAFHYLNQGPMRRDLD